MAVACDLPILSDFEIAHVQCVNFHPNADSVIHRARFRDKAVRKSRAIYVSLG